MRELVDVGDLVPPIEQCARSVDQMRIDLGSKISQALGDLLEREILGGQRCCVESIAHLDATHAKSEVRQS